MLLIEFSDPAVDFSSSSDKSNFKLPVQPLELATPSASLIFTSNVCEFEFHFLNLILPPSRSVSGGFRLLLEICE